MTNKKNSKKYIFQTIKMANSHVTIFMCIYMLESRKINMKIQKYKIIVAQFIIISYKFMLWRN